MTHADETGGDRPTSLLDIALRRERHDPTTPMLVTVAASTTTGAGSRGDAAESIAFHSYGAVLSRARHLASALAAAGVQPGDRVGCYLDNSPSWVVSSLAVWMNGAAVAAAGTLLPAAEAAGLFAMAEASTVVTRDDAADLPPDLRAIRVSAEGELLAPIGPDSWSGDLPDPQSLAVAIFTSGTTGRPKGITHSHHDLVTAGERVASSYARHGGYRPEPSPAHLPPGVLFNPFGHMAGFGRLAFRMWIGRALVVVPRFTADAAHALLQRFALDTLQLSPTMIHMLATSDLPLDLSSVTYVTSGTAPLPVATRDLFEQRFGVPIMQAYGMSETGGVAQERYEDVVAGRRGPGSVGRIAAGVEVRFRNIDSEHPAAGVGDPNLIEGEILVRTDEASTHFIGGAPVPVDDDGWFATGDVGRLEDGILYITGRIQEKIIVGGFNVYPAEVEDALRRSPAVADAVVVGIPDERLGECPVAGVVWVGEPDEAAVLAELRRSLAAYKVPRWTFPLEQVPLTVRDKVDRAAARRLAGDVGRFTS